MIQFHHNNLRFEHKKSEEPNRENFFNHMHNEWELYYFIDGDADYMISDSLYSLKPRDLLFIKPMDYHCARLNSKKTYERIVIDFPSNMIPEELLPELDKIPTLMHLPTPSPIEQLLSLAENTILESSTAEAFSAVQSVLNLLLLHLKYNAFSLAEKNAQTPPVNNLFAEILHFIDENIESPLTLEAIAKHFFISQSWITHSFKRYINTSAKQYINHKKILLAQNLIKSGVLPSETANRLGFNDYSTFFRLYKKYLKVNPERDKAKSSTPPP